MFFCKIVRVFNEMFCWSVVTRVYKFVNKNYRTDLYFDMSSMEKRKQLLTACRTVLPTIYNEKFQNAALAFLKIDSL